MTLSRRKSLQELCYTDDSHAGLWLDRYLFRQPERTETSASERRDQPDAHPCKNQDAGTPRSKSGQAEPPLAEHIRYTAKIDTPELYEDFYKRWQHGLTAYDAVCYPATVQGRMIVGLGDERVLETAITLHHTYGVPFIPGSALKGVAASYARQRLGDAWALGSPAYEVLFGTTASAGYITFFDALYEPDSGHEGQPLWPDVITVHHPDYYGNQNKPPADWDSPNPVSFLSATGTYLIALAGPPQWVATTFEILHLALKDIGVGAKTSSGYGRLHLEYTPSGNGHRGTGGEALPAVDPRQYAEEAVRPWVGTKTRVMMNLEREIAGQGYVVRPKQGQALAIFGFLSYAQAHGRTPQEDNDMNCLIHGITEVDGTWYAEMEWPPKKGKKDKAK